MKRLATAAAALVALGAAPLAHSAATIQFDPDGGGPLGAIAVDVFDWLPGNTIAIGVISTPDNQNGVRTFEVVSQGRLGLFIDPNGDTITPAGQFTFQARFWENGTGVGTNTANFTLGSLGGSFSIYYNSTVVADSITGLGFDAGTAILSGELVSLTGNFTNQTIQNRTPCLFNPLACSLLDTLTADNQNGTRSHEGNGSTTIQVNVTSFDDAFFKSNISSLLVDMQDTTNNASPFAQTNPSDQVFGVVPVYSVVGGTRVNGAPCEGPGQTETGAEVGRCDIHLQTDGSTSFNPTAVPEPGSLAIAGLGLGLLGLARRRTRKS